MPTPETTSTVEIVKDIAQTLAWLIGGLWVLRNYYRDRTHVSRLQVGLDTAVERMEDRFRLAVTITVNNPGRSIAILRNQRSALLIFRLKNLGPVTSADAPEWENVGLFDLFTDGRGSWQYKEVEPGITFREEATVLLPVWREVYLIRLMLFSVRRRASLPIWYRPSFQRIWKRAFIQRIWDAPVIQRTWNLPMVQVIWRGRKVEAAAGGAKKSEVEKLRTWPGVQRLGSRDEGRRRTWSVNKVIEIDPNAQIRSSLQQELQSCKITSPPIR